MTEYRKSDNLLSKREVKLAFCVLRAFEKNEGRNTNQSKKICVDCIGMERKMRKKNNKSVAVVRKLDDLGRITIPVEFRRVLGIEDKESLEVMVEDDQIVIRKRTVSDVFSGATENLIDYCGKKVSRETIEDLARLAGLI